MTSGDESPVVAEPEWERGDVPVHNSLIRHLGVAIVGGTYRPGAVLPNEGEYSGRLSVSRNAFREAMRYLAAKGLVESRRKAGTRVLPRDRWNFLDPDVLAWFFEASPSEEFIRSLLQLRLIVEPPAAELAARSHTALQLADMQDALAAMREQPLGTEAGRAAGARFHRAVLAASGNELLASLASSIDAAVSWTLTYWRQHDTTLPDPFGEHARLFDAIATRDTAAARDIMSGIVRLASRGAQEAVPLPV